jgi:hypothetical protein
MMSKVSRIALALCVLLASQGQAPAGPAFDHAGLARDFLERFMRPEAARFAESAAMLRDAVAGLCNDPSRRRLKAAQSAFRTAAQALATIEPIRFGPNREQSRLERLLLFPDPKGLVRRQVEKALAEGDGRILSAEALYERSVALQGLPALELVLFGEDAGAVAGRGEESARRCGFARAIAENIKGIADAIARAWSDPAGYSRLMLEPSADNPVYLKPEEVTLELAQTLINGIEAVRDVRLAGPLGLREAGKAPTAGVLEISGATVAVVAGNLEGLLALYGKGGLEQRLAGAEPRLARLVVEELGRALDSIRRVKGSMPEARRRRQDRQLLIALGFPLKNAQEQVAQLISAATGISIGFNAGDGD